MTDPVASSTAEMPWRRERLAIVVLASLLGVSVSWVLATRRIPDSSDQAIVGLMAQHILDGRGHPVFYFGSTYAGSLEAHWVALVFRLLGTSKAAYRLAIGAMLVLSVGCVWAFTRKLFGPRAAFYGTTYLALPPFFFLYKGLTSDGAYISVQLVAVAVLAAAVWQAETVDCGRGSIGPSLALGFAIGLGVWITPVTCAVSAGAMLWLVLAGAVRPFWRSVSGLALGAAVGSFPWWLWNLRHDWASVRSSEMGLEGAVGLARNLVSVARTSLAVLTGAAQPLWKGDPLAPYPGAWPIVGVLLVVLLLPLVAPDSRRDRRLGLLALTAAIVLAVGSASHRFVPKEPRYFVSLFVILPPLLGAGIAAALRHRWRGIVALVALGGVLLTNTGSLAMAKRHVTVDDEYEVTAPIDDLLETLRTSGIRHLYANYWTSYRIAFESDEEILATPLRADDAVRIEDHERAVSASPRPAVVLLPPSSGCFEKHLLERKAPFQKVTSGTFGIFMGLDAETLAVLREARSLPLPSEAHAVSWKVLRHPESFTAGGSDSVVLEARNVGPCPWTPAVHLGHWWMPTGTALEAVEVPQRYFPSRRIDPGESFRAEFRVQAPDRPGQWTVRYDLVQEGVAWFGNAGGKPVQVNVTVTPRAR